MDLAVATGAGAGSADNGGCPFARARRRNCVGVRMGRPRCPGEARGCPIHICYGALSQ